MQMEKLTGLTGCNVLISDELGTASDVRDDKYM
jgi:hypothetical protein